MARRGAARGGGRAHEESGLEVIDAEDVFGPSTGSSAPELIDLPTGPVAFHGPVRQPRSVPWPLAAAAFAIALLGAVWLAELGDIAQPAPDTAVQRPWLRLLEASPTPDPTPVAIALGGLGGDPVWLLQPALDRPTVTTRAIRVEGLVTGGASHVEIAIEARGNRVLDLVVVETGGPGFAARSRGDDGVTPFHAAFDLPFPRPNGTMWIVVTAYGPGGLPLGGIRRPFVVGELLPANPRSTVVP